MLSTRMKTCNIAVYNEKSVRLFILLTRVCVALDCLVIAK